MSLYYPSYRSDELYHYGVMGMKWGVRRYQNYDGTLKKAKRSINIGEKKGFTDEQASAIRKALLIAGGVTVAGLAGYAAYRTLGKDYLGATLRTGMTMQRITAGGDSGKLHSGFYAAYGRHDKKRYDAGLNAHFERRGGSRDTLKLSVKKKIKAPSNKKAEKIFNEAIKNDKNFRDAAMRLAGVHGESNYDNYDKFNRNLAGYDPTGAKKQFADILKRNGYNALIDVNDQKYSGYNAYKPLMVFDTSAVDAQVVKRGERITNDMVNKAYKAFNKARIEKDYPNRAISTAGKVALGTAVVGANEYDYQQQKKQKDKQKKK